MSDERLPDAGDSKPDAQGQSISEGEAQALLPAFVLGVLEADEMLAVEGFLQTHPEWGKRLADLEVTAASLAHAAPRAALPARAKEHLLQRIEQSTPLNATLSTPVTPVQSGAAPQRPFARGPSPLATQPSSLRGLRHIPPVQPRPAETAPNWFGVFWRSVVTAGAVAAIVLLVYLALQLRNTSLGLADQITALQAELSQTQDANNQLRQANLAIQQELEQQKAQIEILANPDQKIALAGAESAPTASGDFVRRGDAAVLTLRGLPALPPDQTYQLWLLPPEGTPIAADLLRVGGLASETVVITITPQYLNLVGVGVSIEPAGGSQTPTELLLLSANATGA